MINLLVNLRQQGEINQAGHASNVAKVTAEEARSQISMLERKVDALTIACQALWEITQKKMGVTDEEILAKMREIDARDGIVDGKITSTLAECPGCKRKSSNKRDTCVYCGTAIANANVFDKKR